MPSPHSLAHPHPPGLSPEYVTFTAGGLRVGAGFNLLRPEALEAMWYMWRVTRDWRYRTWGWAIFQAFETHCKVGWAGCCSGAWCGVCVCVVLGGWGVGGGQTHRCDTKRGRVWRSEGCIGSK